jgi:hypothetical protein
MEDQIYINLINLENEFYENMNLECVNALAKNYSVIY